MNPSPDLYTNFSVRTIKKSKLSVLIYNALWQIKIEKAVLIIRLAYFRIDCKNFIIMEN